MASTINATTSGVVTTGDSVATLSLQTGGTTAVAIDTAQIVTLSKSLALLGSTSGSVSIAAPATAGTQSYTLPTAVPAVNGYALTSTTGGVMSWASAGSSQWTTSGSNIYYTTGNVGIGITNPTTPLYVQASGQCINTFETTNAANDAGLTMKNGTASWDIFNNGTDGTIRFYNATASADRMKLTTAGYLLIGYATSNGSYNLQVNSQIFATNATIATSDSRYKKNVTPVSNGLDLVNKLNPVLFNWKPHQVHNFDTNNVDVGFIAQEVQSALADSPYLSNIVKSNETTLPDGTKEDFLGIADGKLIPILVKAIQELTDRISQLETK